MQKELICPNCQHGNPANAAYCLQCGTKLSEKSLLPGSNSHIFSPTEQNLKGLDVLSTHFNALMAGIGSFVVVSGDAFVGKSYLVQKWQEQLSKKGLLNKVTWLENIIENDSPSEDFAFIKKLLLQLLTQIPDQKELNFLEDVTRMSGSQLIEALSNLLSQLSSSDPLILILDNLHHIDLPSAKILEEMTSLAYTLPILFCIILRNEHHSPAFTLVNKLSTMNTAHFSHIHCEVLNNSETKKLINNFLGSKSDPPTQLVNQVFRLSDGNPGFALEIMQALVEDGIIKRINKLWVIPREIITIPIPQSIRNYFVPIFHSLLDSSQRVLQVASIIGSNFPKVVLYEMVNQFDWDIQKSDLLAILEDQDLIRLKQIEPEVVYRFSYPIFREIVLESLEDHQRKEFHALVASVMIKNYPKQLDELATQLADHYLKAEDEENAGLFYANAASNALDRHSYTLAEINYRKALSVCTIPEKRAHLLSGLGESLAYQSLHVDAIVAWEDAAKIFQETNELTPLAEVYARMARSAWWMKDYSLCLSLCLEGLKKTENSPASSELAMLIHETGRAYYFTDDVKAAQQYCEDALRMSKEIGSQKVQADVLATMGILPTLPKRKAVAALQASIRMAENNDLKATASRAYINLAAIMEDMGEIRLARNHRIKALKFGRQNIPITDEALMISSIINTDIWLGEFEDAKNHLSQLRRFNQRKGSPEVLDIELLRLEAQIEQHLGNISRAIELFSMIAKMAESTRDLVSLSMANYSLAEILLESVFFEEGNISAEKLQTASSFIPKETDQLEFQNLSHNQMSQIIVIKALQGNAKQALDLLDIMKSGDAHPDGSTTAIITLTEARVSGASNNLQLALQTYKNCLGLFKKMEAVWWLAHTRLEMAVLHILRNDPEDIETAQSLLRDSLSGFNQMGCAYYPDVIIDKLRVVRQQFREQAITSRENKRELDQAGKVQTSFIPSNLPSLPGWQIAAALDPARETSGDFFDLISLPGGKTGIVIADVGDKGAGAALYMAMCRTLFRGYAPTYPNDPSAVIKAVNERILTDTRDGIFLTAVYGVLDIGQSELIYTNAGHNPPCFQKSDLISEITELKKTGPLIGIYYESQWTNQKIKLDEGDQIIFYTDGVTEAQNHHSEFYDSTRFCKLIRANHLLDAPALITVILNDVSKFTDSAEMNDDITLVVVKKENHQAQP